MRRRTATLQHWPHQETPRRKTSPSPADSTEPHCRALLAELRERQRDRRRGSEVLRDEANGRDLRTSQDVGEVLRSRELGGNVESRRRELRPDWQRLPERGLVGRFAVNLDRPGLAKRGRGCAEAVAVVGERLGLATLRDATMARPRRFPPPPSAPTRTCPARPRASGVPASTWTGRLRTSPAAAEQTGSLRCRRAETLISRRNRD